MNEETEILIVGGGPAGLLTALYLAERHSVALIERGTLGETSKYWVTTLRRLKKHNLENSVMHSPPGMIAGTFLGSNVETYGDLAVVDDRILMKTLVNRCHDRGVQMTENCSLLNLKWAQNRIRVQTTSKSYLVRLVVDATGGLSPIAATFRLHKVYGFYGVYGALLRNIALNTQNIVVAYIEHLGDPPPMLEVIPCGDSAAYCSVFLYSQRLLPSEAVKVEFEKHCSNNRFFVVSDQTEVVLPKTGAIPIGRIRRRRLPGVLPVGEAALIQPPLLGTAFNEVLEYCQDVCSQVSYNLRRSSEIPRKIQYQYPLSKRVQDYIQLLVTRGMLKGNVEAFDRLVHIMSYLHPDIIYNFCSNELSWKQVLEISLKLPYQLICHR